MQNNGITLVILFFGDSLLLNLYDGISRAAPDAVISADAESEDYDIAGVLGEASESGILGSTVYVVTGRDVKITQRVIDSAAGLCKGRKLVIAGENMEDGLEVPENVQLVDLSGLAGAD